MPTSTKTFFFGQRTQSHGAKTAAAIGLNRLPALFIRIKRKTWLNHRPEVCQVYYTELLLRALKE